jgi:hypothetical protein
MTATIKVNPGDIPKYYCRDDVPENIQAGGIVYIKSEGRYYIEDGK